jgi:hypothetical protein
MPTRYRLIRSKFSRGTTEQSVIRLALLELRLVGDQHTIMLVNPQTLWGGIKSIRYPLLSLLPRFD